MHLRDLLGSKIVAVGGGPLGTIHDVRLVQDGPLRGSFGATLRLDGLLAGPGALGVRLGYAHHHVNAPSLVAAALRAENHRLLFASWGEVVGVVERIVYVRAGTTLSQPPAATTGKLYDAAFEILDRQLVDVHGLLAGKVDDLELRAGEGGLFVEAIRSGRGAIAEHLGGKAGRWLADVHRRLNAGVADPASVSFGAVRSIGPEVTLTIGREELDAMRFDRWVRDHLISKIPGASG
jgi:hypothetical protein